MKLEEKKNKRVIDLTWLPQMWNDMVGRSEEDFSGSIAPWKSVVKHSPNSGSSLTNPNFTHLSYAEEQMLKSGAKLQEILFNRAYQQTPYTPIDIQYRRYMEQKNGKLQR